MESESIKQRRMGIDHKGSQGQTQRAVVLQEEEEEEWTSMGTNTSLSHCSLYYCRD
jgi:hypothetical protein